MMTDFDEELEHDKNNAHFKIKILWNKFNNKNDAKEREKTKAKLKIKYLGELKDIPPSIEENLEILALIDTQIKTRDKKSHQSNFDDIDLSSERNRYKKIIIDEAEYQKEFERILPNQGIIKQYYTLSDTTPTQILKYQVNKLNLIRSKLEALKSLEQNEQNAFDKTFLNIYLQIQLNIFNFLKSQQQKAKKWIVHFGIKKSRPSHSKLFFEMRRKKEFYQQIVAEYKIEKDKLENTNPVSIKINVIVNLKMQLSLMCANNQFTQLSAENISKKKKLADQMNLELGKLQELINKSDQTDKIISPSLIIKKG